MSSKALLDPSSDEAVVNIPLEYNNPGMKDVEALQATFHARCNNKFSSQVSEFIRKKFKPPEDVKSENKCFGYLHDEENNIVRPYVRIDGQRNDTDFMRDVYHLLHHFWKHPKPKCILEVTGGAEKIETEQKISQFLDNNSDDLVTKEAWVIASGTDCGIMKIIGDTFLNRRRNNKSTPVCIGIATWPYLDEKDLARMAGADGQCVAYNNDNSNDQRKNKLNLGYDCFLLVDHGNTTEFWQELFFRNQFVDFVSFSAKIEIQGEANKDNGIHRNFEHPEISEERHLPVLLLVVSGGKGTLETIDLAVTVHDGPVNEEVDARPRPVVIVKESGRAVAAIKVFLTSDFKPNITKEEFNGKIKPELLSKLLNNSDELEEYHLKIRKHLWNIFIRRHLIQTVETDSKELSSFFVQTPDHDRVDEYIRNNFVYRSPEGSSPEDQNSINQAAKSGCKAGTLRFSKHSKASGVNLLSFIPTYSRFLRLYYDEDNETDIGKTLIFEKIHILFKEVWRVKRPQVLIEVAGTGLDLRSVQPDILRNFKNGLIEAAHKAKAWLITGGINAGIMKVVGDAMNDYRSTHSNCQVTCLGIATWEMIDKRFKIFYPHIVNDDGVVDYQYKNDENSVNRKLKGNYTELNSGHDHFLLIDTGKGKRYGQEVLFRNMLLEHLANESPRKSSIEGSKTSLVLLVVGGGIGTLKSVLDALNDGRIVVIVKGFCGCADFLSKIYNIIQSARPDEPSPLWICGCSEFLIKLQPWGEEMKAAYADEFSEWYLSEPKDIDEPELLQGLRDVMSKDDILKDLVNKSQKSVWIQGWIRYLTTKSNQISTLDLEKNECGKSLLDVILKASVKHSVKKEAAIANSFDLSLKWNQAEFARKLLEHPQYLRYIYSSQSLDRVPFSKAMTKAIKFDQSELFELLIESGLVDPLQYFSLHGNMQLTVLFHKLLYHPSSRKGNVISTGFFNFFQILCDKENYSFEPYKLSKAFNGAKLRDSSTNFRDYSSTLIKQIFRQHEANLYRIFNFEPYFDAPFGISFLNENYLFLCRDGFAVAVWKSAVTSDFLGTAVMASVFCKKLSRVAGTYNHGDLSKQYKEMETPLETWHEKNVFELAYSGDCKDLIASSPVQRILDHSWNLKASKLTPGCPSQNTFSCRYYLSPKTKYQLYSVSLLIFLVMLYWDILRVANSSHRCSDFSILQTWVICAVSFGFALDSLLEFMEMKCLCYERITVDIIIIPTGCLMLLISSVLFPISCNGKPGKATWAILFHSLSCLAFSFTFFRVVIAYKSFGPKIWAFGAMFLDILVFSFLHLTILFAFSGPIYALSKSNFVGVDWPFYEDIFFMLKVLYGQWWNIVGLELRETKQRALGTCSAVMSIDDANQTTTNNELGGDPSCHFNSIIASILQMVFLIFSNIMLINILTAYLAMVVTEKQKSGQTDWKFTRYYLIQWFKKKPILPPPFNILEIIYTKVACGFVWTVKGEEPGRESKYDNDHLNKIERFAMVNVCINKNN